MGLNVPLSTSTQPNSPLSELSSQSLPSCNLGECGMERPWAIILSVVTSITRPPSTRRSRQPSEASERKTQVTYLGDPFSIASPFIWQRSSAASLLIKGGVQNGLKLASSPTVATQLNSVLIKTGLPPPSISTS